MANIIPNVMFPFITAVADNTVIIIFLVSLINNTSVKIYRTKKLNNGSRVTGSAI